MATWTEYASTAQNNLTQTSLELFPLSHLGKQLREFSEDNAVCSALPFSGNTEKMNDCGRKRKHRKKRMLTGVSQQRRAANDRERRRNVRLNQAFVLLKNTLPLAHIDTSKIEILRLAVKWIDHLGTLLKDHDEQKDLLNMRQMETSRREEYNNISGEEVTPVRHDCLYHQFPDFKNTLWEECIGLPKNPSDDNEGCIHIRSNSRFHDLFS